MIKNHIIPKVKISKGDSFFMLRDGYEVDLYLLPNDLLQNMIIKLQDENKQLKARIIDLQSTINADLMTHGR